MRDNKSDANEVTLLLNKEHHERTIYDSEKKYLSIALGWCIAFCDKLRIVVGA